jgi:MraZ protein
LKLLHGNYELVIDDKNRLSLPAEIRRAIDPETDGTAFYAVTGTNGKLWLWPEKHYELLAAGRASELAPDENDLMFDQLSFALAARVEWDKQGRMGIPEKVLRKTGLGREVTLAAARDHVELWDRAEWSAWEAELDKRRAEIVARGKPQRPATTM